MSQADGGPLRKWRLPRKNSSYLPEVASDGGQRASSITKSAATVQGFQNIGPTRGSRHRYHLHRRWALGKAWRRIVDEDVFKPTDHGGELAPIIEVEAAIRAFQRSYRI